MFYLKKTQAMHDSRGYRGKSLGPGRQRRFECSGHVNIRRRHFKTEWSLGYKATPIYLPQPTLDGRAQQEAM